MAVLDAIRALLVREGVPYRELEHEPTLTSEASARARGEDLRIGGKALVLKIAERCDVFVLSAAYKLDSAAIRAHFGIRKLRFLTTPELHALTGLVPGSVPPFGRPILPCELYVDPSIPANSRIAFNAGSLTHSIILAMEDYLRLAQPTVFRFAVQEDLSPGCREQAGLQP